MRHARSSSCGLLECLRDAGAFAQLKTSDASHRSDAQRPRGYIGPLFMLGRVRGWSPWRIGRCVISYSLPATTPFSDTGATNRRAWVAKPFAHSAIWSRPWLVAVRAGRTVTVSHGIKVAAVGAASATHLGSACNTGMLISARPSWLPMRSRRSLCFALWFVFLCVRLERRRGLLFLGPLLRRRGSFVNHRCCCLKVRRAESICRFRNG